MTEEEFDRIIDRYPYPIANLMSRLGTVECLDPGDRRLNCILDTAEAASRFLCALVLCLCRDHGESQGIIEPLHVDLHKSLRRPSWGHWLEFTREGIKWLLQNQSGDPLAHRLAAFFFKSLPDNKESPAVAALNRLLSARNDIQHKRKPAHYAPQLKALCEETHADLVTLMRARLSCRLQPELRRSNPGLETPPPRARFPPSPGAHPRRPQRLSRGREEL